VNGRIARGEPVAIVGTGYSRIGRRLPQSLAELVVEACTKACHDAGLALADIDGLVNYPNPSRPGAGNLEAQTLRVRSFSRR
jgi:acetyl-CoA acetyltransferase